MTQQDTSEHGTPGRIPQLITAAKRGDQDSFFAVFSHYRGRLEIKIKTELEQEHHCMVDDILQLTYTRAFEKLDRYKPGREFYPWLARVCQNIMREQLRARARGANSYLEDLTEAVEPQDGEPRKYGTGITTAFKGRSSRPPMPDVAAAKRETRRILRGAVNKLSEEDRRLWRLMKKGLTEKELAMAMLLPVSTLAYRLSTLPDKIKREICRQGHSISDMEPIWY